MKYEKVASAADHTPNQHVCLHSFVALVYFSCSNQLTLSSFYQTQISKQSVIVHIKHVD